MVPVAVFETGLREVLDRRLLEELLFWERSLRSSLDSTDFSCLDGGGMVDDFSSCLDGGVLFFSLVVGLTSVSCLDGGGVTFSLGFSSLVDGVVVFAVVLFFTGVVLAVVVSFGVETAVFLILGLESLVVVFKILGLESILFSVFTSELVDD